MRHTSGGRSARGASALGRAVLLAAVALAAGGCMTVGLDTGSIRQPVSMTAEVNREHEVVRHFQRPLRGWFTPFDLVTVRNPMVEEAIHEELQRSDGDAVVNLVIQGQDTFVDRIIPLALSVRGATLVSTGSMNYDFATIMIGSLVAIASSQIRARTYTIEGDVVRYRD